MEDEQKKRLNELAQKWLEAKEAEQGWADQRSAIEAEILELAPSKDDGTITTKTGAFKVKTTGRIYRKVDAEAWEAVKGEIPEELHAVVEYKPKVSTKGFKWIAEHHPDLLAGPLAKAITSTPGKTGISIEAEGDQ